MAASGRSATAREPRVEQVVPAAARTISSLRDIGYELPQAVADLVDNSVSAGASTVTVDLHFDGTDSWIRIADDGHGMDAVTLTESLRYGTVRDYGGDDLGKFGFGLKTASTSQCRRVVVASRRAVERSRVAVRALDLGHIERTNRWEILVVDPADRPAHLIDPLRDTTGTVVLWEDLDRVLDYKDPWGGWAKRKLLDMADAIAEHLGMVFHRFLDGQAPGPRLQILVNGAAVDAWDPFCPGEQATTTLPEHDFRVASESGMGIVHVSPYVLPDKSDFSDTAAWQRASGPLKWNRQQGLYIYRANRLIQWGGWSRIRTLDEHTKLARVALDFSPILDTAFGINISKAVVKLPVDLRDEIEPVVNQVARIAARRYRKGGDSKGGLPGRRASPSPPPSRPTPTPASSRPGLAADVTYPARGLGPVMVDAHTGGAPPASPVEQAARKAIEAAARATGEQEALERIVASLRRTAPEVARDLGW
ncbi:MAG TPA: ATP-binding protein [Streptosporangiaceae bacterium]|nr:ATP-binding protein [Streptosporangiaceae bacterium]